MAKRNISFTKNEYYHIYNRGVDKRTIFQDTSDIWYFFNRIIDLNSDINFGNTKRNIKLNKIKMSKGNRLVTIVAYCLLPNHFHFILKEESENGISSFMQKLGTSYTKYFNQKYNRSGSLFQGKFKAKHIIGNMSLPTLSAYVNLNYKHHGLDVKNSLVKSSIFEHLHKEEKESICSFREILEELGGEERYKSFLKKQSLYFSEKKGLHLDTLSFDEFD